MEARGERHRRRNLEISFPYWKLKKKNCVLKSVLSTFVLSRKTLQSLYSAMLLKTEICFFIQQKTVSLSRMEVREQ